MTNIKIHYKKNKILTKDNMLCFMAGISCIYMCYVPVSFYLPQRKVLECLNGGI
jgi:hypothetical protein